MNANNYAQYRSLNYSTMDNTYNTNRNTNANQNVTPPIGNLLTSTRSPGDLVPQFPVAPPGEQAPQTVESVFYTPGYLKTQIGQDMRVEFLVGSSGPLTDRIGTLLGVGASYILLRPIGTDDTLLCDIYSIKFVTIYDKPVCTNAVPLREMR